MGLQSISHCNQCETNKEFLLACLMAVDSLNFRHFLNFHNTILTTPLENLYRTFPFYLVLLSMAFLWFRESQAPSLAFYMELSFLLFWLYFENIGTLKNNSDTC